MSKKLIWQHKLHALSSKLGFRWLAKALAEQLIADDVAQRTEIGAHKFKYLDRTPLAVPVARKATVSKKAPPVVEE